MLSADFVIATAVGYVGLLFVLAYFGDRRARANEKSWLHSPAVYTLSISVYCTSWTFYGAVGNAARSGLEFLTIYLGPTLIFVGWWFLLRRLVRISHQQRITSLADLLSSRFGKSNRLAVLVTCIAVIGIAPYIALQLKAVTSSIQAVAGASEFGQGSLQGIDDVGLALGIAAGMALFTILFGTRHVDAKEQHHGVVAAIAFEAVVKLAALLAVGIFVVFIGGGFEQIFSDAAMAGITIDAENTFDSRWLTTLALSMAAIVCLPRQFQVTVVENSDENHLRTASWAFPAYMLLMSLFILPIAVFGLTKMPAGSNPDMFALTIPMASGHDALALFAFIGGFSSATSMIILESIALSIMVSNHIIMPLILRFGSATGNTGGVTSLLLFARRLSIVLILSLGFFYFFFTRDSDALAPIGLISFTAIAQFFPAVIAALFWRDATRKAATAAIGAGFVFWVWCSFLPSFASVSPQVAMLISQGPWGVSWLRPQAMFGLDGLDPLAHAAFWSLSANILILTIGSLLTSQSALERLQASVFVDVFRTGRATRRNFVLGSATANDLFFVAERVLGEQRAAALFETEAREAGVDPDMLEPSADFIGRLERELAGSIGAASAHVMLSKVVSGSDISLEEMMQVADETQQVIEYSQQLEKTSAELRSTAQKLEQANTQLRELDSQKDEFLSQVSHEVRTPMTSIRSFSEILLEADDIDQSQRRQFVSTIHQESLRLTKLLDEILDLSALERGERTWSNAPINPEQAVDRALAVSEALLRQRNVTVEWGKRALQPIAVEGDADRLCQVFINLISNAVKYNDTSAPVISVSTRLRAGHHLVEIADNGPGIATGERKLIFEKFSRGQQAAVNQSGAGLGLAISRQIVKRMNGSLELVQGPLPGACFRVRLPVLSP
jgi:Na+/proline symporter/nitrogen-specific signal transduction histidine kinase